MDSKNKLNHFISFRRNTKKSYGNPVKDFETWCNHYSNLVIPNFPATTWSEHRFGLCIDRWAGEFFNEGVSQTDQSYTILGGLSHTSHIYVRTCSIVTCWKSRASPKLRWIHFIQSRTELSWTRAFVTLHKIVDQFDQINYFFAGVLEAHRVVGAQTHWGKKWYY